MTKPEKLSAVKGMNDILPGQSERWQWLEAQVRDLMDGYAYSMCARPSWSTPSCLCAVSVK